VAIGGPISRKSAVEPSGRSVLGPCGGLVGLRTFAGGGHSAKVMGGRGRRDLFQFCGAFCRWFLIRGFDSLRRWRQHCGWRTGRGALGRTLRGAYRWRVVALDRSQS